MTASRIDTQLGGITDLTLLTPIKDGFVDALETITCVDRLKAVLKTLNGLRLGSRESSNPPTLYTDVVSRFRIVHSFRWAVIDPEPGSGQPAKLLLNVNFDGGWEPYMRVIWRDLGTLLDLILCHSIDYQLSVHTSFETYARWVRANERPAAFLFIESGRSVSDHEYLAAQELLQRTDPGAGNLAATRLHTAAVGSSAPLPASQTGEVGMALLGLVPLSALYLLQRYFNELDPASPDGLCLLRAARDILFELVRLDTASLFGPTDPVRRQFHAQLSWLETVPPRPAPAVRTLPYCPAHVQGGMLTGYPNLIAGALVLLHVEDAAAALAWLAAFPVTTEADTMTGANPKDGVYRNISLSLSGLSALGAQAQTLARFPEPFLEGMEQRAGVLGDLRGNHPKYWKTPRRNWPVPGDGGPVDLSTVHIVVQLRRQQGMSPTMNPAEAKANDVQLQANLEAAIAGIGAAGNGVRILAVERMRRNADAMGETRENFGFVDGISQPVASPSAGGPGNYWSDEVPRGDLLLGYPTSRDIYPVPENADPLLDNGTFMVVRKLRQNVGLLNARLAENARNTGIPDDELAALMMGRTKGGVPLAQPNGPATNDFNYQADAQGSQCPFHAHIRRANPRDMSLSPAPQRVPRMLRRGMSYGDPYDPSITTEAEHGLYFIAYNANIAEQFETIQRWVAGGNSSGGYSGQGDPLAGVATAGTKRIYRVEYKGQPVNIDLGDQQFVELQWGGYYFVPSPAALKELANLLKADGPAPTAFVPPAPNDFKGWQLQLENADTRDAAWAYVRSQKGGVVRTAYGVLVGDADRVMEVFRNSPDRYSVRGYGDRMKTSIGLGYLGQDGADHDWQADPINRAIETIGEQESFEYAYQYAAGYLANITAASRGVGMPEATLDVEQLTLFVLAQLCTRWFGLPDVGGQFMWGTEYEAAEAPPGSPASAANAPRCPRDFVFVSRHVFGPHPSQLVSAMGNAAGQNLQEAARKFLATQPDLAAWPVVKTIVETVSPRQAQDPTIVERTLAGIMLGFPPTVLGSLLSALVTWGTNSRKLWELQLDWPPAPNVTPFANANATLRTALAEALMKAPVPNQLWRYATVAHKLGEVEIQPDEVVVIGICSATQVPGCSHFTPFGGRRDDPDKPAPMHACSGYHMAMGVMMGVFAALLEVGPLRPSGAPTVLTTPLS